MHRIGTRATQKDKFGMNKSGLTCGSPQTSTPTIDLDDDYFDMLQEEFYSVVGTSGASLEKGQYDQLLTALRTLLLSRKNPSGDIKSNGMVETVLENPGLGEAAKRNMDTGDSQIPDMGALVSGSGWFRLPGGYIVQFDTFSGNTARSISRHFPIPFLNQSMASVSVTSDAAQPDLSSPIPQALSVSFEHISNSA